METNQQIFPIFQVVEWNEGNQKQQKTNNEPHYISAIHTFPPT